MDGRYYTDSVLAGRYVRQHVGRPMLTHTVDRMTGQTLCKKVQKDSLCGGVGKEDLPPRCPTCLKRDPRFNSMKKESHMLTLNQLIREAVGSQEDIDNMMSRLRDAAIDLSEEMRDFYNPHMESAKVQSFLKDAQDVLTSIGQTHTKWSGLKRKYNL